MAHYLVRAKPIAAKLPELKALLDQRQIAPMQPFGNTLHHSLLNARQDEGGMAVWEEEDYCQPPLAMERAAVLDSYFTELSVKSVRPGEGWQKIASLPGLWDANPRLWDANPPLP